MTRIKRREANETRRRRSFFSALIAALSAWLLTGLVLFGNMWLLEALKALGIAIVIGLVMSIYSLQKLSEIDQDVEDRTVAPDNTPRLALGVIAGTAAVCVVLFVGYQIYADVVADPVQGGWSAGATLATFATTYFTTFLGPRPM